MDTAVLICLGSFILLLSTMLYIGKYLFNAQKEAYEGVIEELKINNELKDELLDKKDRQIEVLLMDVLN